MNAAHAPQAAIVDYGMGNLFSVANACRAAGIFPVISSDRDRILAADLIILPGVGAFGTAMERLRRLDLTDALRAAAASGKAIFGICLGMQLLMTESYEFGRHPGLAILAGAVERFDNSRENRIPFKVPHVGWNRILPCRAGEEQAPAWRDTPLGMVSPGEYMYFVHSFYCIPDDTTIVLSKTSYGDTLFCSSLRKNNIFACQYHPERSGQPGLSIYNEFAKILRAGASHDMG